MHYELFVNVLLQTISDKALILQVIKNLLGSYIEVTLWLLSFLLLLAISGSFILTKNSQITAIISRSHLAEGPILVLLLRVNHDYLHLFANQEGSI